MTELLTGLSTQYDFPRVDLSEDNADLLELMMANVRVLDQAHTTAEQGSWIFRIGHQAVLNGAARRFPNADQQALSAVNNGIATFEAVTCIINGISRDTDMAPANREFLKLTHADTEDLDEYIETALQTFTTDMPRTAEVIRTSTRRFHGPLTSYAVLGAAMSRQFELASVA